MHSRTPLLLSLILGAAPSLYAATPPQHIETITAQVHAEMAHHAETIASMHAHFHHVINCIVDPENRLFDLRAGNPCASMGSSGGALHDEAGSDAQKKLLQHALDSAQRGAAAKSMEMSRVYAEWLSDVLKQAIP